MAVREEAKTRRSYVMAHAHTNESTIRCLRNGVRTVEHVTLLEADGARTVLEHDAYAVPTLVISDAIKRAGSQLGLTRLMLDKMAEIERLALSSLDHLRAAGASIGFGTDLMGALMPQQSKEFTLRRAVCTPVEILKQATLVNAEIVQRPGELGVLAAGAFADILVIEAIPSRTLRCCRIPPDCASSCAAAR